MVNEFAAAHSISAGVVCPRRFNQSALATTAGCLGVQIGGWLDTLNRIESQSLARRPAGRAAARRGAGARSLSRTVRP